MKGEGFWLGVIATIATTIIGGIAMHFISEGLSKQPSLQWLQVAEYRLPDAYELNAEFLPDEQLNGDVSDNQLLAYRKLYGSSQRIIAIENKGEVSAKEVLVEVTGFPVAVQLHARQRASKEVLEDGRLMMTIDAVEPGEQAFLYISGGASSSTSGGVRIVFDGQTVKEKVGMHISLDSGERSIRIIDLRRYLAWLVLACMAVWVIFVFSKSGSSGPESLANGPAGKEEKK